MILGGFVMAAGLLIPAVAAQAASSAPTRGRLTSIHTPAGPVRVVKPDITGGAINGCPYQYACMYTKNGWTADRPEHEYYNYDCYNLTNEYGIRYVLNNQSDNAELSLYYNSGCTDLDATIGAQGWEWGDIGPINSLALYP